MNKEYIFYNYDADPNIHTEYDICGQEYKTLVEICCKYCKTMSLRICKDSIDYVDDLEVFRCEKPDNIDFFHYTTSLDAEDCIRYYRICHELKDLLEKASDSIMNWVSTWGYKNPEDPVFYREDGSVFFSSITHEGECILYPREDEDVRDIISNPNWHPKIQGNSFIIYEE